MYKKEFGYEALTELIRRYNLASLKYIQGETKPSYVITADEISDIFEKERVVLNFRDKLEIVVQRLYQHYKGYSSIDEIRDMNIDGVSGGVSGLPESFLNQVAQSGTNDYIQQVTEHKVPRACDSIWIFFEGKSIRLAFLSFGSESELKRVCQNIYKYNNPGQLSDTNGYKINEMKDGSRVVVVRPSMSETWAFFVRKFDVKRATVEQWTGNMQGKEKAIDLLNQEKASDELTPYDFMSDEEKLKAQPIDNARAQQLKMNLTKEEVIEALKKRKKSKVSELTLGEALEILDAKDKAKEKEIKEKEEVF